MQNQVTSNENYRLIYLLIWALIATGYASILILFWHLEWLQAWADAFVFSSLFAVMGIAVWYIVKFSGLDSARVINTLATHLVAAGLLVFVLVSTGEVILNSFISDQAEFYGFQVQSPPELWIKKVHWSLIPRLLHFQILMVFFQVDYMPAHKLLLSSIIWHR